MICAADLAACGKYWKQPMGNHYIVLTFSVTHLQDISQPLHLPLVVKAGEAFLAGEELLHGGLFEVALLGDELVQRADQRIHIAQRPRDGALFRLGRRKDNNQGPKHLQVQVGNGGSNLFAKYSVLCSLITEQA